VTVVDEAARGRRIAASMSKLAPCRASRRTHSFQLRSRREGTCAEGARLNIIEIPATARCEDCGLEFPITISLRMLVRLLSQNAAARGELNVRSIELEPQER